MIIGRDTVESHRQSINSPINFGTATGEEVLAAPAIVVHEPIPFFFYVDSINWKWKDASKATWSLASQPLRDFRDKWYGTVVNPESTSLSLEPLPSYFYDTFPLILVRKSHVTVFDHILDQVMASKGRT